MVDPQDIMDLGRRSCVGTLEFLRNVCHANKMVFESEVGHFEDMSPFDSKIS